MPNHIHYKLYRKISQETYNTSRNLLTESYTKEDDALMEHKFHLIL
jgi:hypothetical protein